MAGGRTISATKRRTNTSWTKREKVMGRYARAAFRKMGEQGLLSSAHNLGHVERVARYASVYVELMGGGRKKRAQARIAGLTHDRFRDAAQSIGQKKEESHETRAPKYMKPMFDKRYKPSAVRAITEAMEKHGSLPGLKELGKNVVRDGIVFADKFFEANGAYIGFRRSMFMGERVDIRKKIAEQGLDMAKPADLQKAAVEVTLAESDLRIKAFSDLSKIPPHMHPFVKYQVEWQKRLVDGLKQGDAGITNLVTTLFREGLKSKPRDLGEMITAYTPISKSDAAFKQEALDYLNGKLVEKFKQLVKRPA